MIASPPDLFDRLSALADPTRSRVLLLLETQELTVSELCAVLQLPQSTASRHLKTLGDEGWVVSRSEGTSRIYSMAPARLDPAARRLWAVVRDQLGQSTAAAHDTERLRAVLAARRRKSEEFFSTTAGQWDRVRAELFGATTGPLAMLGLLDDRWTVGDLGCGTGQLAETVAPFVHRVIAIDSSAEMLAAARHRLQGISNAETRRGQLEALPMDDASADAAMLSLVLHYVPEPQRAIAEASRVLRPGGRLLVVDMMPHDREEYRHTMGHVWQGFALEQVVDWLGEAGLVGVRTTSLPSDPQAKGPTLFAATARKE